MSDYHPAIVDNLNKNCLKNDEKDLVDQGRNIVFDWRQHTITANNFKQNHSKDNKKSKKNKETEKQ